jgi:hypothetical protein
MLRPFAEKAFIDDRKLLDYCLSEHHQVGKHKARVFKSALGIDWRNYDFLKSNILDAFLLNNAEFRGINQQGNLYEVDFELENPPQKSIVRTAWIIRNHENFPRLITCYIIK